MNITFFHWSKDWGYSIPRSFSPLIEELKKKGHNIQVYHVPYYGANPIKVFKNILFVHKHRNKNGINHITGDIHYCELGLIGMKSILSIHDDYAIIKAPSFLNRIYKWIFWIYFPIKIADKSLCITEETKKKILKYIKSDRIDVFTPHSPKDFFLSRKKFNKEKPIVLQIGIGIQKNLESTIKALEGVNCHLRVIKPMTKNQHDLAKNLKIEYSNVYDLTDKQIIDEYLKADIIAFPSIYEGLGMPIMEGQAVGRVVITSDIAPMNWVAGDGAALLKNPLDIKEYHELFLKIINNDAYREDLIDKGVENIKRFSIDTIVEKYERICSSIC